MATLERNRIKNLKLNRIEAEVAEEAFRVYADYLARKMAEPKLSTAMVIALDREIERLANIRHRLKEAN